MKVFVRAYFFFYFLFDPLVLAMMLLIGEKVRGLRVGKKRGWMSWE